MRIIVIIVGLFVLAHGPSFAAGLNGEELSFKAVHDVPRSLTVDDVCCGLSGFEFFEPNVTSVRSFYGEHSLWLKVIVPAGTEVIRLTPILDDAQLFVATNDGKWTVLRTGDSVPKALTSARTPYMAFQLPAKRRSGEMFIRIVQPTVVTIGIKSWSSSAFVAMHQRTIVVKTFLLGGVCAIILYNIFVSFLIRNPVFLLNAMAVISMLVFSLYLSGYGQFYIWPGTPERSNSIQVFSLFNSILFGSLFVRMFLRQGNETLFRGQILLIPPILGTIALISYVFLPYWIAQFCMVVLGGMFILLSFGISIWQAVQGNKNAFILCFPLALAIVPGFGFSILGKIWGITPFEFGENGFEIALFIEAIILSLAMASIIRLAEMETTETHHSMIRLRNENTRKVIVGQDAERERIAKELHDGVGQDFLLVLGKLKGLVKSAKITSGKDEFHNMIGSAEEALYNLRNISRHMHPSSIEHLGLEKAVQIAVEDLASTYQIDTSVKLDFSRTQFSPEWQLHIYRVIQSCISNLVFHSKATFCQAYSKIENGTISIVLEDDGVGFDVKDVLENSIYGLGLTSIRERAIVMGGELNIGKSDLGGASIELRIPIKTPDTSITEQD